MRTGMSQACLHHRCATTSLLAAFAAGLVLHGCSDPSPQPQPYAGVQLPKNVHFATARRWDKHKLEWLEQSGDDVALTAQPPAAIQRAAQVTILVHGYAVRDKDAATYFGELITYLHTDRGYLPPVVVYDWPSRARHWQALSSAEQFAYIDFLSNTVGERLGGRIPGLPPDIRWEIQAYSGDATIAHTMAVDGLMALLRTIQNSSPVAEVNLVAHSLGSRVVAAALERPGGRPPRIRTIVLIAPDLGHDEFEKSYWLNATPRKIHVFYSRHDFVLARLSRIMNFKARLGAVGPRDVKALTDTFALHDVSEVLGAEDAHSSYLTRAGAAAIRLGDVLQ
jgi:esterase/lipase superfamily enzyme